MKKDIKLIFAISTLLLSFANPLNASDHASSNVMVSAVVASSCNINQGTLTFGTYDATSANASSPLHTNANLQIRCTKNTTATISLDRGMHSANASGTSRAMANSNGNEYLSYDIYTSSNYNEPWTEATPVTYTANTSDPMNINIYGAIPANQTTSDGTYNDVVTINATF